MSMILYSSPTDAGHFDRNDDIVMVIIDPKQNDQFRYPTGSEGGGNQHWKPRGYGGWYFTVQNTRERVAASRGPLCLRFYLSMRS